ncbi:MAG: hypothetical protein V9G14_15045 [Cypionkella sp.]
MELKRLHVAQKSTTIYVTHDQIEAMALVDRIVVMHAGVPQQVGTPAEVYANPVNLFTAQFVGSPVMNVLEVAPSQTASGGLATAIGADKGFSLPSQLLDQVAQKGGKDSALTLGVRPEAVELLLEPTEGAFTAEAHIIEPLGLHDIVDVPVGGGMIRARTKAEFVAEHGTPV